MMFQGTYYELFLPPTTSSATPAGGPSTRHANNDKKMVMVHGLGVSCKMFYELIPHYQQQGFTILAYDLIGRGKSLPPTSGRYGVEEHVQQLSHLLQHLQWLPEQSKVQESQESESSSKFYLLGISMGGAIASLFTSTSPHLINSLILLCPAGIIQNSLLSYIPYVKYGLWTIKPFFLLHGIREQHTRRMRRQQIRQQQAVASQTVSTTTSTAAVTEVDDDDALIESLGWYDTMSRYVSRSSVFWDCFLDFPFHDITSYLESLANHDRSSPSKGSEGDDGDKLKICIIWGTDDTTIPIENLGTWKEIFNAKNSKSCLLETHEIENGKHGLIPANNSVIQEIVDKFLF